MEAKKLLMAFLIAVSAVFTGLQLYLIYRRLSNDILGVVIAVLMLTLVIYFVILGDIWH